MTDQPKFAVGDPVIYAHDTVQRCRGDRAVVTHVTHHDGAYWRYNLDYLDGSTSASSSVREINLEADHDTRIIFITMPCGAEHPTHELASDHARLYPNVAILKASQERTSHGWKITACSGPIDPLPKRHIRYYAFDADHPALITVAEGVVAVPRSDRDYFKVEFVGIRPVSVELVKGLRP